MAAEFLKPRIFLSSRMRTDEMSRFREDVHKLGRDVGKEVWVFEYSKPDLYSRLRSQLTEFEREELLDEAQIICLQGVRDAEQFIAVLDGSYGSPLQETEVSILETEIFIAVLTRKDISIFRTKDFDPDSAILSLLNAIEYVRPGAVKHNLYGLNQIKVEIESILVQESNTPTMRESRRRNRSASRLVELFARRKFLDAPHSGNLHDVRFAGGRFFPITERLPDKERIQDWIKQSKSDESFPIRTGYLWIAFRHLSAAPFNEPKYSEYRPLWNEFYSAWMRAIGWYGIHGHFGLSRLATINSLQDVRRTGGASADVGDATLGLLGARASEYYSIAKMSSSLVMKRKLYGKALNDIEDALSAGTGDQSGRLAIRGSIYVKLGRLSSAIDDYETVLRLRVERRESGGRIGEAEVELGAAYALVGRLSKARELMESGVHKLLQDGGPGFAVRALRKLSRFYTWTFRRSRARELLQKAYHIADVNDLEGQIRQLPPLRK